MRFQDKKSLPEIHSQPLEEITGAIKFYDPNKGYGFIVNDADGQDVFIARTIMERSGFFHLKPKVRIRALCMTGPKGRVVREISLEQERG
jgi:CspA family cold shock protein